MHRVFERWRTEGSAGALMVAGLGATQTIGWGTTYYLPAVLVDALIRDLQLSRDGVFAGVTVMLVVAALVGPRAGLWIDRTGPKRLLCVGSLLLAGGLVLLGLGRSAWTYYLAWAALGLGVPTGLTVAAHTALARYSAARARRSIGTLMLFTGLASTIFWPITSALADGIGWRTTCLLFAGLHLLVCLPIHLLIPEEPARARTEPGSARVETPVSRPVLPASRHGKALVLIAIAFSLQGAVAWGLTLHVISLFTADGMSPAVAVSVAALMGPATVGGRLLDVALAGRIATLTGAIGALMLTPIAFLLLMAGAGSTIAAMLFVVIWSAANGTLAVARATLPLALFGTDGLGRMLGVLSLPQNLFYAASPVIFSAVIERAGPTAALELGLVCVLLACAAMVALARLAGRRPE